MIERTSAEAIAELAARGYVEIPEHGDIRPGARCRNYGEQFPKAYRDGTANVLAVMQRKGSWERIYQRPDIEVVVERTRDGKSEIGVWADYGLALVATSFTTPEEQTP